MSDRNEQGGIGEPDLTQRSDGGGGGVMGPSTPAGPGGVARPASTRQPRRVIDAGRLWTGGVMAGIVAAGVAVVGLLIARGVLDIPVLIERKGHLVDASSWWYAGVAFLAALAATALMHGLLAGAPQPYRFFNWIVGLAVAIAALIPFTTGAELSTKIAVAVINLAIGICIGSIVSSIGHSAARVLDEPYGY
ncbi:MAG TPA: DUF6069 family protein [Kineosporiaceae bacterium]|nr:DUF6069 family protein [Kineosporiaceae bacterium]